MSQHDETKRMLGLIRETNSIETNKNKKILREQNEKDGGKEDLAPAEYAEEQQKFRDTVSPRVKFNSFKLYPKAQNVEFSGEFTDSKIEWFYSLDDARGVYITGTFIQLRNEVVDEENAEEGPVSINSPEFGEEDFAETDETENV